MSRLEQGAAREHPLRHYNYLLQVAVTDATDLFRQDSSFTPVTAWS